MTFPTQLPTDTVLDCILDEHWEDNGILHVLDVLRWRSQDYTQCEAAFRYISRSNRALKY
jgi:snurportin-1